MRYLRSNMIKVTLNVRCNAAPVVFSKFLSTMRLSQPPLRHVQAKPTAIQQIIWGGSPVREHPNALLCCCSKIKRRQTPCIFNEIILVGTFRIRTPASLHSSATSSLSRRILVPAQAWIAGISYRPCHWFGVASYLKARRLEVSSGTNWLQLQSTRLKVYNSLREEDRNQWNTRIHSPDVPFSSNIINSHQEPVSGLACNPLDPHWFFPPFRGGGALRYSVPKWLLVLD
jgi:hypothetical protein